MRFEIRRSINNVYKAFSLDDGRIYTCILKGKILKSDVKEYNPVAVGDIAIGECYSDGGALLTALEPRKSSFTRWNTKAELNQVICANQDQTAIVLSAESPPFRPRFVDRAIASNKGADILLIMNKSDYGLTEDEFERWALYHKLGYNIVAVSALTGEGLDDVKAYLRGKTTAFVGQSGVGKSSLINRLIGADQRTGDVSEKYNRGKHTTNHALYIEGEDFNLIDTPGVREILIPFENMDEVQNSFPELRNLHCMYATCLHRGEPGCEAERLLEDGRINADRYESYLRMLQSLEERRPKYLRRNGIGKKSN